MGNYILYKSLVYFPEEFAHYPCVLERTLYSIPMLWFNVFSKDLVTRDYGYLALTIS